ncbi:MAG: 2-amino-4-hydroxy-6-hydroxymethyldihydropteridine diphosphokinase [Pirellulaceae bacterium]|nr:2-amino-4-hydroxy-6-hydroxymethyldihydropteridine diphosphokinase [Pirellulaceae bacterium]
MSHREDMPEQRALIAFGANLGDRNSSWQEVLTLLSARGARVLNTSRLFETSPIGGPTGQAIFLNAALTVQTALSANQLVAELLAVEREIGRVREARWGPRLVDLDLMLYGQEIWDSPACLVPHPRMSFRRFMLEPACEVAGDWIHPLTNCSLRELLGQLDRIDRRATVMFVRQEAEKSGRVLESIRRLLEVAGWTIRTEVDDGSSAFSEPVWTIVISGDRHPPEGAVDGPYLVLPASEPESWEPDILAAVQAMTC